MKYFIVGFMASGKSRFAKKLGQTWKLNVLDSDELISKKEGMDIPRIFSVKGEKYFRNLEYETMTSSLHADMDFVMSTGGGLPCHHNLMEAMKDAGKTIYLKLPFEMLLSRLVQNPGNRPLATNSSKKDLEELFVQREPVYELADYVLDDNANPIEQLEALINSM